MKDNQKNNKTDDGFEAFDDLGADDIDVSQDIDMSGELVDDIDYSDLGDDNDADVFAEDANQEPPKKKSGALFNVIVFGGAVLVAAGFIGFNILNKGSADGQDIQAAPVADTPAAPEVNGADIAAGTESDAAAQQAIQDAVNTQDATGPVGVPASGGLLDNPDQLTAAAPATPSAPIPAPQPAPVDPFSGLETASAPVPMPAPIVPETAGVPAAATTPTPTVTPEPAAPVAPVSTSAPFPPLVDAVPALETAPAPAAAQPQVAAASNVSMPAPEAQQPQMQPQSAPMQPQASAPVAMNEANNASAAEIASLNDKLSALNARLDALSQQMSSLATAPATQAQSATPSPDVKALEAQLSRLESRLATLSEKNNEIEVSAPVVRQAKAKPVKATAATPSKKAESAWDKPYKPQTPAAGRLGADVSVVAKAPAPVPVVQPVAATAGGWRLQGAQPGRAILGSTSGDIREVGVGDTVPGLGRITAIGQMGGQWVVQATGGAVSQ